MGKDDNDEIRGLYFPEPHAGMAMAGEKTMIARPRHEPWSRTRDLRGEWLLVTKRGGCGLILGAVSVGEPIAVGAKEFDDREAEHRIGRKDRLAWWGDRDRLWLYPVRWRVELPEPRRCIVPPGTQTVMRDVEAEAADRFLEKAAEALPAEVWWTPGFVWLSDGEVVTKSGIDAAEALGADVAERLKEIARQHPGARGAVPVYDLVLRRRKRLEYVGPDDIVEGRGGEALSLSDRVLSGHDKGRTKARKGDRQDETNSAEGAPGEPGTARAKSLEREAGNVPEGPSPSFPVLVVVCDGEDDGGYMVGVRADAEV